MESTTTPVHVPKAPELETKAERKSTRQEMTLRELGPTLPIGVHDASGALRKELAFRPWRFEEEQEISAIRAKNPDANLAGQASMLLAPMLTRFGPHTWEPDPKKEIERRVVIGQAYMADVLYSYLWLRYEALGPIVKGISLTCPHCRNRKPFSANLETLKVTTIKDIEDSYWSFELTTPIMIRKEKVAELVMGQARWNCLESMQDGLDGTQKAELIRSSIQRIPGMVDNQGKPLDIALGPDELREMTKRDIERLVQAIDDNHLGPDMSVEDKCSRCSRDFKIPLDWTYSSFFEQSSP